MDLHKYPLDTQHCPLMIGSCELVMFIKRIFILTSLAHYRLSFIRVAGFVCFLCCPSLIRSIKRIDEDNKIYFDRCFRCCYLTVLSRLSKCLFQQPFEYNFITSYFAIPYY